MATVIATDLGQKMLSKRWSSSGDPGLTTRSKKLLRAPGIATRSKDAILGPPGLTTRSKKLLGPLSKISVLTPPPSELWEPPFGGM